MLPWKRAVLLGAQPRAAMAADVVERARSIRRRARTISTLAPATSRRMNAPGRSSSAPRPAASHIRANTRSISSREPLRHRCTRVAGSVVRSGARRSGAHRGFMIQPALHRPLSVVPAAPLWSWRSAVALAVIVAGVAAYSYRASAGGRKPSAASSRAKSALKARFDDVFDRSSDVMIVHDRRGRVSTINRAGEQATGYSREEVRMLDPNWIFGNDYLDTINQMIAEGADSAPQAFRSELVAAQGSRVPVDVHARVLVGDGAGGRRHGDRQGPERARSARERAAPGAEDGSGRPARHRHRARLQQPDHGAARLQRRADRGSARRLAGARTPRSRCGAPPSARRR